MIYVIIYLYFVLEMAAIDYYELYWFNIFK